MTARPRPDFLCLGAHKAGTTWLATHLRAHPRIWSPYAKELHHFSARHMGAREAHEKRTRAQIRRALARAGGARERRAYLEGLLARDDWFSDAWYRAVFAPAPRRALAGDFTPLYGALDDAGLDDIKATVPDAKAIYLVREPVARAESALRMNLKRRRIDAADAGAVAQASRAWLDKPSAMERGAYADCLPRLDARWGEGRMLYLPFGRIRRDPEGVIRAVEAHLGLKPHAGYAGLEEAVHVTPKVPLPDFARAEIAERMARHAEFLEGRFPRDFLADLG